MKKAASVWSGGKDSALALHRALQRGYDVQCLVTTASEQHQRVTMHGVRLTLVERQAEALGLPLYGVLLPEEADGTVYDAQMLTMYQQLKTKGIEVLLFGDIHLEDLRVYRERQVIAAGMQAVFPLWGEEARTLLAEYWRLGFRAVICCANETLGENFAGAELDPATVDHMPLGTDLCGERGEYHTFVYEGPLFRNAPGKTIRFVKGDVTRRVYADPVHAGNDVGFWYCDLIPVQ